MRVLLVHPEDSLYEGPWASSIWHLIIDLGWAGTSEYSRLVEKFKQPFRSFYSFSNWHEDIQQLQKLFALGNDWLVDTEKIDWWQLIAPSTYQKALEILLLSRIATEITNPVEVCATRQHPLADQLGKLLDVRVNFFAPDSSGGLSAGAHFTRRLRAFTVQQALRIALDKWDTDYKLRRFFSLPGGEKRQGERILLPSAYRNVTRAQLAYTSLLPDCEFLLVTTRKDGSVDKLPAHVSAAPLAAYAPIPRNQATENEIASLTERWQRLKEKLRQAQDPFHRQIANLFTDFDRVLRNGLRIRDAWRAVFEKQKIIAVLCGDENNLYTRLPVLLAKNRGIHTVYCNHGALDANVLIRGVCSETYLTKGEMEKDYLVRQCGVPGERIFVGAPSAIPPSAQVFDEQRPKRTHIVFFSEPYELYSGRTESLYREILPALCKLAREHDRKVMVKLHPFESLRERTQLVKRILNKDDRELTEITAEPMSERLMQRIWVSLTVESSVAVECAVAGVPSFLCGWFDLDLYGYAKQYEKFGAARILHTPAEIPGLLSQRRVDEKTPKELLRPITYEELTAVLQGTTAAVRAAQPQAS